MKYCVLILLLFGNQAFAQKITDGFWGIPYHTGIEQVKKTVAEQKYMQPSSEDPASLTYSNAEFAGETVSMLTLRFVNNKMYSGNVIFERSSALTSMTCYELWRQKLIEKYGEPTTEVKKVPKGVSVKNNAQLEKALDNFSVEYRCHWTAKDKTTGKDMSVVLMLANRYWVTIMTFDTELCELATEQEHAENAKDY
jgi:hypothetical protein